MTRRTERVSGLLRDEISQLVLEGVSDPRLGSLITIVSVEVAPDLQHASVRVSVFGDAEQEREVKVALDAATGFFRTELAKRLQLKRVPELKFVLDKSIQAGDSMLALLDSLKDQEIPQNG